LSDLSDNFAFLAGDDQVERLFEDVDLVEDWRIDDDCDEWLVVTCFERRGLRLNLDTVRGWSADEWQAADAWVEDDQSIAPRPSVIVAAEAEYAAARKCRACGCTEYFACEGGCSWAAIDLCTSCLRKGHR
jgi:hypothetical protein